MVIRVGKLVVVHRIAFTHSRIVPAVYSKLILGIEVVVEEATLELCTATATPTVCIIEGKYLSRRYATLVMTENC